MIKMRPDEKLVPWMIKQEGLWGTLINIIRCIAIAKYIRTYRERVIYDMDSFVVMLYYIWTMLHKGQYCMSLFLSTSAGVLFLLVVIVWTDWNDLIHWVPVIAVDVHRCNIYCDCLVDDLKWIFCGLKTSSENLLFSQISRHWMPAMLLLWMNPHR